MAEPIPFEAPGPVESEFRDIISSIEDIIDDARNGRMFILVDHEDRENEGDLVTRADGHPGRDQLHGHPRARIDLPDPDG